MKVLVTGGYGQLGTALGEVMTDYDLRLTDTDTMDITSPDQIEKVFAEFRPDFLVHGAAYTNVDGCEENPELAESVNASGTQNLAAACARYGAKMIYISTDYVFDGSSEKPYRPDDPTGPISVYGRTKLAGEQATAELPLYWILRTSWVYGVGQNFVRTMLSLAETHDSLEVVSDQWGRPTWASDLARAIRDVIKTQPNPGIYHVTGDGPVINWAEFATKIFDLAGKDVKVNPVTTEQYMQKREGKVTAPRPHHSALDLSKSKKAGLYLADWEASLRKYLS